MKVLKCFWQVLLQTIRLLSLGLQVLLKAELSLRPQPDSETRDLKTRDPETREPKTRDPKTRDPKTREPINPSAQKTAIATKPAIAQNSPTIWLGPGKALCVHDFPLKDALVYVGQDLPSLRDAQHLDPCLIQPSLAIESASIQPSVSFSRILSYQSLSPSQRGCYLHWLSSGRNAPEIDSAYLYLYLYGLERRLLTDVIQNVPDQQRSLEDFMALHLELERLQSLYGSTHDDLWNRLHPLINLCQVQMARVCQPETLLAILPQETHHSLALNSLALNSLALNSLALNVAIENCIRDNSPLPVTLFWAWYQRSSLAMTLKTPAKRCGPELGSLLALNADMRSLIIEDAASLPQISIDYLPVSNAFGAPPAAINIAQTLDLSACEDLLSRFQPLVDDCTEVLDGYSRLLGRSPEAAGTPAAVTLLPAELVLPYGNETVRQLDQWITQQFMQASLKDRDWVSISGQAFLELWPTQKEGKLLKKEAELLAQFLEKLGVGMEPDVRFGGKVPAPQQNWILFWMGDTMSSLSHFYSSAIAWVDLMIHFRGHQNEAPIPSPAWDRLAVRLTEHFKISRPELTRVKAHAQWRHAQPAHWHPLLASIKKLSPEFLGCLQDGFTEFLDQHPEFRPQHPEQQVELNAWLGGTLAPPLSPLRRISASSLDAVEVQAEEPALKSEPLALNFDLIQQRQQDSREASLILTEIFAEDSAEVLAESIAETPEAQMLATEDMGQAKDLGLDQTHLQLLQILGQKTVWNRQDLESLATERGLMLDGALENINDVAFEQCDEALAEGEDPIEINPEVFEELWAA